MKFEINSRIEEASTLPASFYKNLELYEKSLEQIFVPSWQWIGDSNKKENKHCYPFELLSGSLNEPLLLSKDAQGELHCLSNVCTHRGKILVEKPGKQHMISCGYHGRCFHLNGKFRSMPEFKQAENFPSEADHLPSLAIKQLGNLLFTSLSPQVSFETVFAPIMDRMSWFNFDQLQANAQDSADYIIDAHWALYCDNYLEGFHVPFVHPGLGERLSYQNYHTEIFDYCNLQLGVASDNAPIFDIPKDAVDYGKRIHAYYWWIFPNIMLNIYTWGVSVNVVEPLGYNKTRVKFRAYLLEGHSSEEIKDSTLHETEMEDEEVVISVQKGLQSRLYKAGRFSPKQEKGVHHFHSLLAKFLSQ
ncbi:MAG: Rieske 2Fe-2S domain-containing protein [Saprospiraceae bacterium]|nr:Rieske 2Fe-2S domain-containing protein [Saprospiraceae bacterium]